MKRIARKILGLVLIIIGLLALLTPFSPGSWLALVGLELLGVKILTGKKISSLLGQRYENALAKLKKKLKAVLPSTLFDAEQQKENSKKNS